MICLLVTSLLWAFSFGLIGQYLRGVDPLLVALIRLGLSFVVFLPFLSVRQLPVSYLIRLMLIGAVQYGLMYICYIYAYQTLAGHEVALFTVLTPAWVVLFYDWRTRRFHQWFLLAAILSVAGGVVLVMRQSVAWSGLQGIVLVQVANMCFAIGQVEYKLLMKTPASKGFRLGKVPFGWLYLGAVLAAALIYLLSGNWRQAASIAVEQWVVLIYLGVFPSALGFFLWNEGARRVNAGVLAVCNNLKTPLAMIVSLIIFRENVNIVRLVVGSLFVVAGLWVAKVWQTSRAA